jgi:RNA polymerase sigma factor (sigma-70 family)
MHIFKGISTETTDLELIEKYKRTSDLDYVAELYSRYLHLIFSVSLKYLKVKEDAEDISIKIFEILKEKLPDQEIENVGGWIHTVTKNQCLMQLRSVTREQQKEDDYAIFMEIENNEHHTNEIDIESDIMKLEKCIKELVKEQKKCIELFYKQEKCYKEVANLTGYGLKKVKSYLQNGKRNIAICMEK